MVVIFIVDDEYKQARLPIVRLAKSEHSPSAYFVSHLVYVPQFLFAVLVASSIRTVHGRKRLARSLVPPLPVGSCVGTCGSAPRQLTSISKFLSDLCDKKSRARAFPATRRHTFAQVSLVEKNRTRFVNARGIPLVWMVYLWCINVSLLI